jgi:hypothetical protein
MEFRGPERGNVPFRNLISKAVSKGVRKSETSNVPCFPPGDSHHTTHNCTKDAIQINPKPNNDITTAVHHHANKDQHSDFVPEGSRRAVGEEKNFRISASIR